MGTKTLEQQRRKPLSESVVKAFEGKYVRQTPYSEIVELTEDLASWLMSINDERQRDVSKGHVNDICKTVDNNGWELNGDTIKISTAGTMMDGQHRVLSFLKDGCPKGRFTVMVCGLDPDVMDHMDDGVLRRSTLHKLKVQFYGDITRFEREIQNFKFTTGVAAAVRVIAKNFNMWGKSTTVPHEKFKEALYLYVDQVKKGLDLGRRCDNVIGSGFRGAIACIASKGADIDCLNSFIDKVATQNGFTNGDPAKLYYKANVNYSSSGNGKRGGEEMRHQAATCEKYVNAWLKLHNKKHGFKLPMH